MSIVPAGLNARHGVAAGFSTRLGGESVGPFRSLNLSLSTGDDPDAVTRNRRRFFGSFGIELDELAIPGQIHGDLVRVVEAAGLYPGHDGLVTTRPRLALCIVAADCAAVLLADPVAGVIGACHSGWRGTAANIAGKTLATMVGEGAETSRIHAFIGPSIGLERFEVGPEVAERFAPIYVRSEGVERPHVDLKSAIRDQLIEAGVSADDVETSPYCTYERTDLFYSYRAEGGRTGRMMGFIIRE